MQKINVAILGYGNLGKSVEKNLLNDNRFNLFGIFSNREINSIYKTKCYKKEEIFNYKNKIEIVIMCGGSQKDIPEFAPKIIRDFNLINSYDSHKKISSLNNKLNKLAKDNEKVAINSCGWDPGFFSVLRTYFNVFFEKKPKTFWGKGKSMGHTQALKKIKGIKNAVSITIPNKLNVFFNKGFSHKRKIIIVKENKISKKEIIKKIKNNKEYFSNAKLIFKFISEKQFNKKYLNYSKHGGVIYCGNKESKIKIKLSLKSNANFTAKIMTSYLLAIKNLYNNKKFGAYLPTEINPAMLLNDQSLI